jgi:hypothetical protein
MTGQGQAWWLYTFNPSYEEGIGKRCLSEAGSRPKKKTPHTKNHKALSEK